MLIKKYNGVESRHGYYEFKNVEVLRAGERDPDYWVWKECLILKMRDPLKIVILILSNKEHL